MELGAPHGKMELPNLVSPPDNHTLPAGYTYFGQFITHDITFDATSSLQQQEDPEAIRNYRTPALDLDSLYGGGPLVSPHLYDRDGIHFLIEKLEPDDPESPDDLPRNSQGVALVADPRNDDNVILGQLTLAFLKFHNHVADELVAKSVTDPTERFQRAQDLVRWHYQWIVLNQYLPRVVGQRTVQAVLREGRKFYHWSNAPYIPVEFSVAAFRFGHSQIRVSYRLNEWPYLDPPEPAKQIFNAVPIFRSDAGAADPADRDLSGGIREPGRFVEWDRFFDLGHGTDREGHVQLSKRIGTRLVAPLFSLPKGVVGRLDEPARAALAQRDLLHHLSFSLPSGQAVAHAMREHLPDIRVLDENDLDALQDWPRLQESTPLWYYILREAELLGSEGSTGLRRASALSTGDSGENQTLGPVGGRIVAEVLIGLIESDPTSLLRRQPRWCPEPPQDGKQYGIEDLLQSTRPRLTPLGIARF
jgi:hypothetical protein